MRIMSGVSLKPQPRPRVTVRSRLRPKAQLTLPEEIGGRCASARATRSSSPWTRTGRLEPGASSPSQATRSGTSLPGGKPVNGKRTRRSPAAGGAMHGSDEAMFARLDNLRRG